jgi:integrase
MASLYRRGKVWWIYACSKGKRLRWSLGTTDERIARRKLKKYEYEQSTGDLELPSVTSLEPFLEAFCEYLETARSRKAFKNDLSYLRTFFGPACEALKPKSTLNRRHKPRAPMQVKDRLPRRHVKVATLEELTPRMIEEHIIRRIRLDGIAPKTANRLREVLHVMFNYAIRQHGFRSVDRRFPNPVDAVPPRKQDEHQIRFLSLAEVDQQLETLADHRVLQTMVAVLIYAGLRREEVVWLTCDDVDLDNGMIRVWKKTVGRETWRPKTRRNRRVPISSALRSYLDSYGPPAKGPWYFPSPRGPRWDPDHFSQRLREINHENGLVWSCLDFRHTFGSQLAIKGESLYKISELLGNSPEICRRHYAALIPEQMRDTVEFGPRLRVVGDDQSGEVCA